MLVVTAHWLITILSFVHRNAGLINLSDQLSDKHVITPYLLNDNSSFISVVDKSNGLISLKR